MSQQICQFNFSGCQKYRRKIEKDQTDPSSGRGGQRVVNMFVICQNSSGPKSRLGSIIEQRYQSINPKKSSEFITPRNIPKND